jgi:hypothetical protein
MNTLTILAQIATKCTSWCVINNNRVPLLSIILLLTFGVGNAWGEMNEDVEEMYSLAVETLQSDAGDGDSECNKWVKVGIADIEPTDDVVITIERFGSIYAMPNNGGMNSPSAFIVEEKNFKDKTAFVDELCWNIIKTDKNFVIYPKGVTDKWLYCIAADDGVRVGIDENYRTFKIADNGYLYNIYRARYIGVYSNTYGEVEAWGCYAKDPTLYTTSISKQTLGFYKYKECSTQPYTRTTSAGSYGTICLPNNIIKCEGATLYEVAGKEGNKVIFDEVANPVAGMPYIFIANQEVVKFFCGADEAARAGNYNSLQGTFEQIDPKETNDLTSNYVLYNNIIKKCGANCGLLSNRAYFLADELESLGAPSASQVPGRRRISLDFQSENATTNHENIFNSESTTIKVLESGQLIIIRNGEKFNAQGHKL